MSFAEYVKKRKKGQEKTSVPSSANNTHSEPAREESGGFAAYVQKRRSGEIPDPVNALSESEAIQFDRDQAVRRRQTNNPFQAAVESYNAGKVDMSKLSYREGLNPNQTIGNAGNTFTPLNPEPANLTREGQWAAIHPVAGLGMYAVTNYIGGGEGVVNMLDAARREAMGQGKIGANEINAAPLAQAYRTGASEGLRRYVAESNENLPKILRAVGNIDTNDGEYSSGEQALDFLSGVGADAASSSLNMAMGGNISTYLMGANAANQSLYDTANDEKTTSGQALALAAANGIAEAFFEKFSVENAGAVQELFRRNPVSVKDFAKTLVVSAGVEGSEEMNTEIANILADIFIRGTNSESGRMYARAIENGAEPNAAAAEVLRANLKQIGMAGLGGALSGGLHTGLYSSVGTMQRGMDLHNMTSAADIMDTIDTSTKEGQTAYDIASEIAKKEASGKRATAIDYGRLQNAVDNAVEAAGEAAPSTENAAPSTEETAPSTDDVEIREVPRGDFRSSDAIRQTAENVRAQMDADYQEASNEMYGADTEGIKRWGGDVEGSKENKRSYHIPVETLARIDEDNRQNKAYSGLGRYGQETFDVQSFGRDAYDSATSLYNSIRFGQDLTEAEKMRNARLLTDEQVFNISQAAFKDLNSFYNWDRAGKISAMAEKHTLKDVTPGKVTYADGIDIDAIRADGSKEARQKVAQMAYAEGLLSKVFGYNVHWIQSGIDDNTGRYVGENGSYDPSTHTISLDINAGANYVGDAVKYGTVISHELTHTLELGAVEQYKKIADSVMNILVNDEEYSHGRNAQQIIADMIENNPHVHNESEAVHELVAQACEDMLNGNRDVQEMLAGLDEAEQKSFFDRISEMFNSILQFIEDMLSSDAVKSDRREAEALRRAKEEIEGLRDTWNEGVKNAAIATKFADLESAFGEETGNIIRDESGEAVIAESEDGKSLVYSIRTLSITQQKLAEVLKEKGYSAESIKAAQDQVQDLADMMTRVSVYYAEMAEALDAELLVDPKTGKTVLHSFVTNGDYPINIDFLTVCKKREAYMRVLTDLIEHGVFDKVAFNGAAIATTNEILRDSGFETACACCFVESRRLQIQRWAETFCSEWNEEVLKRNPNATPFNFSKGERGANDLTQDEIIQLENELRSVTKKEKNPKGNIKLPGKGARANMGPLLDRIPSLAHTLSVGDLITPNGIDSLRTLDGNLFSLVKQRYGTATPKITQSFSPYSGDVADLSYGFMRTEIKESVPGSKKYKADAKKELIKEGIKKPTAKQIEDRALRKYLYDIGGVRLQSFSDFLIENTLDYFQMFADLAAKGLPLHAYSKEISFIKIFGMTGGKMNMSLIPTVDLATDKDHAGLKRNADGTWSYAGWGDYEHHLMIDNRSFIQSIGFKDAIAMQLHPGYSSNIGTIAIGISDAHIRMMLNDPLIRMVIPYHSSGMLPEFAKQMHIDYYHDYTTTQNTTLGKCTDMDGNEVETYSLKGSGSYKCDTHYDFNEAFQRLGDARAACEEYKEWCKEKHPVYKGSKQVGWAEFTPKFAEFADEPNYYKLIEDFNSYDCITEAPAIQGAVTMSFPGAEENLLDEEQLKAYEERLRATGQFSEKEIQKYVSRANESIEEIITREAKNRNAYHREMDKKYDATLAKIEGKLQKDFNKSDYELVNNKYERIQRSAREYSERNDLSGVKAASRQDSLTMDAVDDRNVARYKQEISSVLDGTMKSNQLVLLGKPSAILQKYLKSGNPLYMPQSAVKKAVLSKEDGGKHGLGRVVIDELPYQFADPMAITGNTSEHERWNDNSIVVWTDWMTESGDSIIVPIRIEINGNVGIYNNVNTAFDAWDQDYVKDLLREGNVLYTRNGKSIDELLTQRREVPKWKPNDAVSNKRIAQQNAEGNTSKQYSARDSSGNTLTAQQTEYFKDSKVRDKDGNLMVVYHGTPRGDFTVFDNSKIGSSTDYGWYGKGFYFTDKESAAKYYAGYLRTSRVMKGYLNITNPYELKVPKGESIHRVMADAMGKIYDSAEEQAEAFTEWLKDNGYDGLITKDQYMVFDSNQFKNIDNQNPTENEDVRYSTRDNTINGYTPSSIGSIEELMRYNSGIRDMSAGLAAALEAKGANGAKLSDAQIEKIARKFIKEYGSQADPRVIADGLKSMYEYIDATSKVSASQLGKIAHDYAREILNTASETDDTLGQLYPELRDGFKKARLKLTDELKGDIVYNYDSIPNFKRQMRGALDISEKGTQGVDTYYEELKGMYPDLFPDDIINPSDQLQRIAEVAEMLQKHTVKTDFGEDLDEVAYVLGQEMLAQYFAEKGDSTHKREVAEIKTEMVKKHQAEMAALRAEAAKEYGKLKARLGDKALKVANVRAELNAMHRRVMERRELRLLTKEAKKRLMTQARKLWTIKGPREFESAKRELIGNLDLVSYGMSDGTRVNLEKLRRDALAQAAKDEDYMKTVEYADIMELTKRLGKERISDMSLEQIMTLTKSVLALKNAQQSYNRMLKEELGDYVAVYGRRLVAQQKNISGIRGKSHMLNALKRYALYMENPTRVAHLLDGYQQGGVFTELFDDINAGAIKAEEFKQKADEMFKPVLEDKELNRTWSKQNIPIEVNGQTYYISKGMRISMYLHSLNKDNKTHIKNGGFNIPDEKLYRQGRYTEAYAAGTQVPMDEATLHRIANEMTPAERRFAEVAKDFFNKTTKEAINEVSLQLKGYELAAVDNYFPIRTDPNFTQKEIDGLIHDASIEGAGQFKDRQPGSKNPILLEDVAQVIQRQTHTTAQYYGLAIPVRNANKVWKYTSTAYRNSAKDAVAKNWLTDGAKIFENVLKDIQAGARRGDTGSHLFNLAKGAYATSVLMGNVGVSLKQSASYPLAIHMLDAASLAKGIVGKVDREYMDSITPLSWARRHGMGGQVEVADVFRQKGMIDDNPMAQKMKDLTNWIQAVDVFTTDHLFVACEEYVKAHNPGLEVRGDEYNKMVADLYNSVLQRTQPSYGVMQRNELMRSSDAIMKALTMFKTQTFNMGGELLDAGLRVNALAELQKNGMATKTDVADAKRKMVNVVGATILSQAMLSIIDVMGKALLHKMKPYRDEEGNVTLESVVAKTARDFGSSFFGLFFGLDVASQMASAVTGGKWYDVTAPQLDGINEAISATSKWSEALSKYMNGSGTKTDLIKQSGNMAIKISGAFGIPANNVYNIANAVNLWVQDVQTGKVGTFESGYGILGITDTSLTAKQYKDRLYRAVDQYGYGTKEYEKAMDELKRKTGKEEKEIFGSPYDDLYQVYREHGENSQEFKNRVKFLEEIGKKPKDIAKALNNRGATVTIK